MKHRHPDGTPRFTNRLAGELSPYLLQHAHNPVDWYPWGDEAFETARKENRPVLLSIGYSACHWCHVMEEESFEDLEIAAYMNKHYVAVKVDREQRPDIDAVYMAAVQMLTGSGGWPMTVWLTPDRKPFYGGTYFPPRDGGRGGRAGFLTVLQRLHEIYQRQPADVAKQAAEISSAVAAQTAPSAGGSPPGTQALHDGFAWARGNFDAAYGGFGLAPKFPRPAVLEFLFHYGTRAGMPFAVDMAAHTLRMMARGGMYDQLGGGFHRYSVDAHWLVPHFEKMLYDQAQLVTAYLEVYQLTGDPEFARVARETLDYVAREMTDPEGGFYSATDADSEGEEGKFFVWSKSEILGALGTEAGEEFCAYFNVTDGGNFEGKNILNIPQYGPQSASLNRSKKILYNLRLKRVPPFQDDKILTAWNGLMIGAFARGAFVLSEPSYAAAAAKAAGFISTRLMSGGRLLRSFRAGKAEVEGFLDDYVFFAAGLLELYEATGEARWLKEARALTDTFLALFRDEAAGGFFMTGAGHEALLAKEKPYYDGAEPSGNSAAAFHLLRMESFTSDAKYGEYAAETFRAFAGIVMHSPYVAPLMLAALDYRLDRAKEIVLVEPQAGDNNPELLAELRKTYIPNRIIRRIREGDDPSKPLKDGRTTAYVCEGQTCDLPATDANLFSKQLKKVHSL